MKIVIISILIIGMAAMLIARVNGNSARSLFRSVENRKTTAKEFVDKIDSLGYFKYTDQKNLEELKQNHLESFDPGGAWGGVWDDKTLTPLDFRYYFCDGEYVFEQGGFTGMLEKMKPTFERIGYKLNIDNHFEEWDSDNEWLNHSISINSNEYVIFKNFKGYGWGEAVQRLAEILNAEFEKNNIEERIYLISGGNDGALIFLTDELYNYFYAVFTNPQWKPLEVNEWVKIMGIKPTRID